MTDTLDLVHRELDESLQRQLFLIDLDADFAGERLDDMVDEGNRRQLERMLDFNDPWRQLKLRVNSNVRTFAEQKALWERWREGKDIAFAIPGQQSHRLPGPSMAIDIGDTNADPLMFVTDWEGRMPRYWGEPWHFEYQGGAPKRKPWWKRAWRRLTDFFRSVA